MNTGNSRISLNEGNIIVTGGAGFFGQHIVSALQKRGARHVIVPRSRQYNLVEKEAVIRLFEDHRPEYIIHAAGTVGGIGANRANPARFFYDNLIMGIQLVHVGQKLRHLMSVGGEGRMDDGENSSNLIGNSMFFGQGDDCGPLRGGGSRLKDVLAFHGVPDSQQCSD